MGAQVKNATTLNEQITLLRNRGMAVDDRLARQWLSNISYYRLSGYSYPYRVLQPTDDPKKPVREDRFVQGTSFEEVAQLYEFDRKLRTLIHDAIERIEIALRTRIGEWIVSHGPLAYQDSDLFHPDFDHVAWLDRAMGRVERAKKSNAAIRHYSENYDGYPFWVLAETLDFSDISILYGGLPVSAQHEISTAFGFKVDATALLARHKRTYYRQDPLARWCEQLSIVRNVCAHHGRLFNRRFTPASTNVFRTIPGLSSLPRGQSERLYGALLVIAFMLRSVSPGTTWTDKLITLIKSDYMPLSLRHVSEMGFSEDWETHLRMMMSGQE